MRHPDEIAATPPGVPFGTLDARDQKIARRAWTFIGQSAAVLRARIGLNAWWMRSRGQSFDPSPCILLEMQKQHLALLESLAGPAFASTAQRRTAPQGTS